MLIIFALTIFLLFLITISSLYLSLNNKIHEKEQIEYWNSINENLKKINDYNKIEFIGGPFDGDWKFLPKENLVYIYKNHQYIIEEIDNGQGTKKVYKYCKK